MKEKEIKIEIIEGKLYWISSKNPPVNIKDAIYFNTDKNFVYNSFKDFGPLDINKISYFSQQLINSINKSEYNNKMIIHHTTNNKNKRTNAALLMGGFMVL
jgi:hypothetical protein